MPKNFFSSFIPILAILIVVSFEFSFSIPSSYNQPSHAEPAILPQLSQRREHRHMLVFSLLCPPYFKDSVVSSFLDLHN